MIRLFGHGHPLPIWLALIGAVDVIALPFLFVAYVREALGPHEVEANPDLHDASDARLK